VCLLYVMAFTAARRLNKKAFWQVMGLRADIIFLIMMVTDDPGWFKPWYCRLFDCCKDRPSTVLNESGGVYIWLNCKTKCFYVGETQEFLDRIYSHWRSIRQQKPAQYVHQYIRLHGFTSFFCLPIMVELDQEARKAAEAWFIGALQPQLNRKKHRISKKVVRVSRRCGRVPRLPNRLRKQQDTDLIVVNVPITYTTYTMVPQGDHSKLIDVILRRAVHYGLSNCMIQVDHGDVTVRPKDMLTELYLDSVIVATFVDGSSTSPMTISQMRAQKIKLQFVVNIEFQAIIESTLFRLHKKILQKLFKDRKLLQTLNCTFDLAVELYTAAGMFTEYRSTKYLRSILNAWSKYKFGVVLSSSLPLRVRHSEVINIPKVRQLVNEAIMETPLLEAGQAWLRDRFRLTFGSLPHIKDLVCNFRHEAKTHDPDECHCERYPEALKDPNKHVNCRISDMAKYIPGLEVLCENIKDVVSVHDRNTKEDLKVGLKEFVQKHILIHCRQGVPNKIQYLFDNLDMVVEQLTDRNTVRPAGFNTGDVRAALKKVDIFVRSELDKNNGCLHVQCRKGWHADFQSTFIEDPHYERIHDTEQVVLRNQKVLFQHTNLRSIAPWQRTGSLPYAYILKKHKDVTKSRPVVACCAHPTRTAFAVTAKGGSLAILLLCDKFHIDVATVYQMVQKLWNTNPMCVPGQFAVASFDVKQMFTELTHEGVLEDALTFFQWLHQCCGSDVFHVPKGKKEKAVLGPAPCRTQAYEATFMDVYKALEYELENMVFKAGIVIMVQKTGAGMGGRMSPFGARVTCIVREHKWQMNVKAILHGPLRMTRLMDDTQAVLDTRDIPVLDSYENDCYRKEIHLVREQRPNIRIKSLGCHIGVAHTGGVYVLHGNKNEQSILTDNSLEFPRFPGYKTPARQTVKVGTIKGQLTSKILHTSPNAYKLMERELWLFLAELNLRQYPWKQLYRIFLHTNLKHIRLDKDYAKDFTRVWRRVLKKLKKVAECDGQGIQIPV
jgi:hypothetical protein